jgi:hypothetical protein
VKRYPPEEHDAGPGPLFAARKHGHEAARAAAERASRIEPAWKRAAIEAVRMHAQTHERFTAERVGMVVPASADHRASGHIMRAAAREGICVADGFAPTVSSRGSPKVLWRSLIYEGAAR